MLLLEPSLRYVLGGNFPSAVQSEGEAATVLFMSELLVGFSKQSRPASAGVILHTDHCKLLSLCLDLNEQLPASKCINYY